MTKFFKGASAALLLVLMIGPASAGGNIMITTYTEDFQVVNGNIGCPKGPWGSAFAVNIERLMGKMPERDMERLMRLIGNFETHHGVDVSSKTRVKDFQLESDKVRTESVGPVDDAGAELCALAAKYV